MSPFGIGVPMFIIGLLLSSLASKTALAPEVGGRPLKDLKLASPELTKTLVGPYPATIAALAVKWGKVFGISKSWLRSMAFVESKNVPTSVGPVNSRTGERAHGALQLMPSTAAWLVAQLRKSKWKDNLKVKETLETGFTGENYDLLNPDFNIMLGAFYLSILKTKYKGDYKLIMSAYNQGPTAIDKQLADGTPLGEQSQIYLSMLSDARGRGFM